MTYTNSHGFTIIKDSKTTVEATARFSETMKLTFKGRLTFEKKWTPKYGSQLVICVWLPEGKFPELTITEWKIRRGRIEICIPEEIALNMDLLV